MRERFVEPPLPATGLRHCADGCKVARRLCQNEVQLGACVVEASRRKESAAERDPRRGVFRMNGEAGAACLDGVVELPRTPVFLGELREGDRPRVALDPEPEVVDSGLVGHRNPRTRLCANQFVTTIFLKVFAVRPISSRIPSTTM